jgi:hypothetical protein
MEDGRVLALLKPFQGSDQGGDPVAIDINDFVENDQADLDNPALQGPAQVRLSVNDVRTDPGLSPGEPLVRLNSSVRSAPAAC